MRIELQGVLARHPAARVGARPAIQDLNLRVDRGEQVAVIGPSGAGKTTLLQVMACALRPGGGALRLDGVDPWALPRSQLQRLRAGLVLAPQVPPLPPRQRVITSVLAGRLPRMGLWASVRSLFYPSDIPAAHAVLDRFDVADKLFERVDRLSGGERQRVGLARALLALRTDAGSSSPRDGASLMLVDEPLSALDPARARQAIAALVEGAAGRGVTVVATLHQVDVALAHFPRIVGLRDGQQVFDLPAAEVDRERLARLYAQHEHELRADAPALPEAVDDAAGARPVVMHCR